MRQTSGGLCALSNSPLRLWKIGLFALTMLVTMILGCSTSKELGTGRPAPESEEKHAEKEVYNSRAIRHYMEGVNAALQGNYALAALEYQQALRYDSSSATIYGDLSDAYVALKKYEQAQEILQRGLRQIGPSDETLLSKLGRVYYVTQQWENALGIYSRLSEITTDRETQLTALEYLANIHLRGQEYREAAQLYEQLYNLSSDRTDYLIKAQNIYMRLSEYNEAKRILRTLIREYPDEDQYQVELATVYSETGRADSAITLLQPIASEKPRSDAAALLGELYFQSGQMDSAYSTLQPLDEGDSTDVRVLYYLGGAALNKDLLDEAERYYRQLMEHHTDILGGYFGLGVVLRRQERYRDAIAILSQGVQHFPEESELYEHLGINYYFAGQQDSAWKHLDQAYAIDSTLTGYYNLAITLRNKEMPEEAVAVLSRAKQVYPAEAGLYEQLGISYYAQQRYQEAKHHLQRTLSMEPDLLRPKHFLAFVYDQLGRQDSAEVMYKELLQEVPDEPLYLNNLAYLYAVQGKNLEIALEYVKKALERAPNNASYLDTMGWVYYKMGQYEEAREYISEALNQDSTNAEVLDHMGDVYTKLGDQEMAQEFYRRALEKNPDDPSIRKKLQ